jgi:2',3'-cyclic-nucleotide 2'-phosphodiesterase (5'-nucleotidase family)
MRARKPILVIAALLALGGCSGPEKPKKPKTLTIVYSNDLVGEIRSCGCATNDFGGLGRRATFISSVRDTTGDMLLLDAGDFFSSKINYGLEKADLTLRSLDRMEYHGMVIGETDLGFGVDFLVERVAALDLPVVAANLYDAGADSLLFPPAREVTLDSGLKVGIVGAFGQELKLPPQVKEGELRVSSPSEAVKREVDAMRDRVDVVALVAHMGRGELQLIAREVPGIDVILYGHKGKGVRKAMRLAGAYALQAAERGQYMGVAFAVLGKEGEPPIRRLTFDTVALSPYYDDDEAIAKLFRTYDLNIAAKEKSDVPAGVLEARRGIELPFVGAEACKDCHEDIYDQWSGTHHAYAFETLVEKSREFDRDCTPCHSTGFYKLGGFESYGVTPELANVQCEACHGNGYRHTNDPDVLPKGDARGACRSCHDEEMSPDFDFATFWDRIRHDGEGSAQEGHR